MRSALLVSLALLPAAARANPITVGASLGVTQSEQAAGQNVDPDDAYGLFGRVALGRMVSVQGEISRTDARNTSITRHGENALVVVDLATRGTLVPIVLAGAGLDQADVANSGSVTAHHFEAGLGLEYRSPGGFVAGADVRIGDRTIDSDSTLKILACCTDLQGSPDTLAAGQYRSAHAFVGVRF